MKNLRLLKDTWAGLLVPPTPSAMRAAWATLSHSQEFTCVPALIAALAMCGVLTGISLFIPPFIDWDSANGFLAWRGTLLGVANSIITPDLANIARDTAWFLTVWSPGQYLVPGAISLLGVPLGVAMTLTVALALLASLIGWVMIVREFAPRTNLAVLVAVLIGAFHYSTHAFSTYHGGEILLQAATPWLALMAYRIPETGGVPAALLAVVGVLLAFLAKLTGLVVAVAALIAGSIVNFAFGRRITYGMLGGALGAMVALAIVYITFLSRGPTAASETSWSVPFDNIAFAFLAPWVAGMSWPDPMYLVLRDFYYAPAIHVTCLLLPAALVIILLLFWRPKTTDEQKFRLFSLSFSAIVAVVFISLFIHGAVISPEERHFRSAGTLMFVCALTSALAAGIPRWMRGLFLGSCALMALYGLGSFSYHEMTTAKGQSLDRTSWTNQRIFDAAAVDFARGIYAREGRDALFVLPSYQLAVTFPVGARIIVIDLNNVPEATIAGRYSGRVPGHVVMLMTNDTPETSKGRALLSAFTDYARNGWERKTSEEMSVFFQ